VAGSAVNVSPAGGPLPARAVAGGIVISVHLTPKAGADEVCGIARAGQEFAVLRVRVRAAPEDGKANAAVAVLLANWLDQPKSAAEMVSGGKSRRKQILIRGDAVALMEKLVSVTASLQQG
jgi:uncharacterized protein (TIGR00251 family)